MSNKWKAFLSIFMLALCLFMMIETKYLPALGDFVLEGIGIKAWTEGSTGFHLTVFVFGALAILSYIFVVRQAHLELKMNKIYIFIWVIVLITAFTYLTGVTAQFLKSQSEGLEAMALVENEIPNNNQLHYETRAFEVSEFEMSLTLKNYGKTDVTFYIEFEPSIVDETPVERIRILNKDGSKAQFTVNPGKTHRFVITDAMYELSGGMRSGHGGYNFSINDVILSNSNGDAVLLSDRSLMGGILIVKPQETTEATSENEAPDKDAFNWAGKTIEHLPALSSVQGLSFEKITTEPNLIKFTLGASSAVIFERLGLPNTVGWIAGSYIAYDDLLIFSEMEEKEDTLTFSPINTVLYFGEYAIAGIEKGMSFKEVEQIIGAQDILIFTEYNELNYPLSVVYKKDGFSIGIGFDAGFKVTQFLIRIDDGESDARVPDDVENVYFEAANNAIGPMIFVFEILNDPTPSVITLGEEDGILYKIDLDTNVAIPVSGPNYKGYVVYDGMVIRE